MEEGNEREELDVTPTVENDDTPGGTGSGADDGEPAGRGTSSDRSDRSSRSSGNRWSAVRDGMGDSLRKGIKGDPVDHTVDEDDDLEDDDDLDDDEDLDDREDDRRARGTAEDDDDLDDDERDDKSEKGERGKGAGEGDDDEDEEPSSRYEVVDAESGDKFKIDLPKGATIRFPGDGKVIEAKSFDDVIKLAQKGAAFDRVSSTAGQENAKLRTQVKELVDSQTADEDLLLKLVFGELEDEELETLQKELGKYRDPEAREGLKSLAREKERKESEKADGERQAQAAATEFWDTARGVIAADLNRFEFLDTEDSREIETKFYGVYTAELDRLLPDYKRQAKEQDLTDDDAMAAADRDARKLLTEKTLRRVMKDLNAKYEKRSTKGRPPKGEKSGRREVERHNKRVVDKREQRRDPARRSLRSGGAAPRDREPSRRGKEPVGFDAKLRRGLARLREAGRAGSGGDEE